MLRGRGNSENIVCPLHRWTYDLRGELLGAPHFAESPCVKLRSKPLTSWNGLLFTGPRDPRRDLARVTTMRVDKARKVRADLFVSIHADAFVRPDARGSSVFALSDRRATSEMARILAKQENEADLIGGVGLEGKDDYVRRTIIDLWQTGTIDHSLRVGGSVLKRLGAVNTLHKPQVEQASFKVLTAPNIPSILVETAFISNPEEEKRLNDDDYQEKLARAVLDGIRDYFARHPPRPASPLALN